MALRRLAISLSLAALSGASLPGQGRPHRPLLVGTVGPQAFGAPAPTPTPLGGLVTRPIPPGSRRNSYWPLRVADAPLARAGVVVVVSPAAPVRDHASRRLSWTPTAEKPRWVIDSTLTPVQSQRDLIVSDVVCNYTGVCRERRQRVAARWVAPCGCYAFADGWNRIWRVE
ncbi:hypothetical protein [Gemmatimonas sp.]|uniref:hypothetical protein n=1 Tax=Gemmatimonas sp. TaxID=1962908 RepID=UPI003983D65D